MRDGSENRDRRSIRLPHFDYSQPGGYYVTICSHEKYHLFGSVTDGEVNLRPLGLIVDEEWNTIPTLRDNVVLDSSCVMPNHFHGILFITETRRGTACRAQEPARRQFGISQGGSLSTIVGSFKSSVARRINMLRNSPGAPVWQRNYYEHVIRNEADLAEKREYIKNNPLKWELDEYYCCD